MHILKIAAVAALFPVGAFAAPVLYSGPSSASDFQQELASVGGELFETFDGGEAGLGGLSIEGRVAFVSRSSESLIGGVAGSGNSQVTTLVFDDAITSFGIDFRAFDASESFIFSVDGGEKFDVSGIRATRGFLLFTTASAFTSVTFADPNNTASFAIANVFVTSAAAANAISDLDEPAPVPLPAGLPLLALGLGALGMVAGRKKANRN